MWISDMLSAGHALGFFIARDDGSGRDLSHAIQRHRGRYYAFNGKDELIGSYATLARADTEGFAASLQRLHHGIT